MLNEIGNLAFLAALFSTFCCASDLSSVRRLPDLNSAEREEMLEKLIKTHTDGEVNLKQILANSASKKEVTIAAVYLAGLYRLGDTVSELAKIIFLEEHERIQKSEALWGQFPVVEALIKIGNPSVPKMLELIQESSDPKTRKLAATVILHIETESVGAFILQKKMDTQTDAAQKERLGAAIQYLKEEDIRRHPVPPAGHR